MILALEGLLVLRFGEDLLFAGKGHSLAATMLMVLSIFVFLILSLVGIAQLLNAQFRCIFKPCCKEKIAQM